jgi:hypothetical protein
LHHHLDVPAAGKVERQNNHSMKPGVSLTPYLCHVVSGRRKIRRMQVVFGLFLFML